MVKAHFQIRRLVLDSGLIIEPLFGFSIGENFPDLGSGDEDYYRFDLNFWEQPVPIIEIANMIEWQTILPGHGFIIEKIKPGKDRRHTVWELLIHGPDLEKLVYYVYHDLFELHNKLYQNRRSEGTDHEKLDDELF